ncbi:MAG: ABC transporter ATP-binding protein [Verrucomicrobiota bacterium]|nr:ABC transporter ATP-binding protein [Verrucomicrobiota bacterium]
MLESRNVFKTYFLGKVQVDALKGVDVKITQGKVTTIRGASGAGKSTLLQLFGALDKPTSGEILLEGRSLGTMTSGELSFLRNNRFGFIFQAFQLLPELDALENVHLPAMIRGKHDLDRAARLLEEVGLGSRKNHKPLELSGGEQQRVAIARCLINDPDIIFADEPTGNLDSGNAEQIASLLIGLVRREKKTLLLVTHEKELAEKGDIQLQMRDGKFV